MSLSSRISARSRRPTATVRLGGRRWSGVLTLSRDQAFGQGISSGTVLGRNPPVEIVEGETTISWTWGYDGYEVAGFTGIVTKILNRAYPNQVEVQVADPLWLADIRRGDIATSPLNTIAASEAITQILGGAGLTRLSIPALPASGSAWAGSEWTLGTLTPVSFSNTTALAAAQSIAETLGYWLYADASGVARATLMERRPSSSPVRTLRYGVDFLLAGPPERSRDAAQVRNRIVVRGANTGVQGAQIFDAWTTGAGDRSLEVSYPLVEYVNESEAGAASATAIAKRLILLWSRQPNVISIGKLKADPRFAVGQTVAIVCSQIGYPAATPFFIYALSTSLDLRSGDFAQQLTLDGGVGSQGYTTVPPPTASFTWRLVREGLNGTAVVELFLDATGSISNTEGEIVSYSWSTATATALSTPTTATGPRAMFIYPAATTEATVTLTVTDTSSKTGSITQTIPLAGDELTQPATRVISLALGAAWAASPDGGQAWNVEASGDATLVPEAGGQTLLATRASGATGLRATTDALASASTALASLGGTATALSQTVNFPLRVWAAVGANLFRSIDGGATFAAWGTLPATITAILEDPAQLDSVFVLAGPTMYQSISPTNPGTSWAPLYAGPAGATARHLIRGQSGATTWICYTGTFTGSPLQRVEGPLAAAFPVVSPVVSEIRAIALAPDDELTVYAWDQAGRGWAVDSTTGVATAIAGAALAGGETAQHALHDPDDPIVYLATFGTTQGTTYKYFPLTDSLLAFYVPAAGQQAHRVGLGEGVVRPVAFVAVPQGASGGDDRIWIYDGAAWRDVAPPVAGAHWYDVKICPYRPAEWLLIGNSQSANVTAAVTVGGEVRMANGTTPVLWRTTDAGVSWEPLTLTSPVADTGGLNYEAVAYDPAGRWVTKATKATINGARQTIVWRDAATAVTVIPASPGDNFASVGLAVGQAGDVILGGDLLSSGEGAYAGQRIVITRDDVAEVPPGPDPAVAGLLVLIPGTRSIVLVALATGVLYTTSDYRAAQPTTTGLSGLGTRLAPMADGTLLASSPDGVIRVTSPLTAPAATLEYAGSATIALASDAATRAVAAAVDSGGSFYLYDGTGWRLLTSPLPVDPTKIKALDVSAEEL